MQTLQDKKLELEIKELQRPFWQKYFSVILTTALAITTVIFGFASGIFDIKYERLQLEKTQLQRDVNEFQQTKEELMVSNLRLIVSVDSLDLLYKNRADSLAHYQSAISQYQASVSQYQDSINQYQASLSGYKFHVEKLKEEIVKRESEIKQLVETKNRLDSEVEQTTGLWLEARQALQSEEGRNMVTKLDLERSLFFENLKVRLLTKVARVLAYQTDVVEQNPFIRAGKKNEFVVWTKDHIRTFIAGEVEQGYFNLGRLESKIDSIRLEIKRSTK